MSGQRLADLIGAAHRLLSGLESRRLTEFLEPWPKGPCSEMVNSTNAEIPGLRHLPQAGAQAAPFSASFAAALAAAAPLLAWRRSYSEALVGADFWDNYGWTELIGLSGPARSEKLACGVMLLGPRVTYPLHHHEAEEMYVPLSGTADWKLGTHPWEALPPGTVIHHPTNESHAMRTGDSALLALYLWRSDNLAQKSRLDAGDTS